MYVLIKFTLLVYLSYIYSVNQSSYSVANLKKKYLGLLQILQHYIYFLPPRTTEFLQQDLHFQDLATIKFNDFPCSLKPRAASE